MRAAVPTLLGDFAAQLPVGLRSTEAGFAPIAMPLLARLAGGRPTGGDQVRKPLLGAALAALVHVRNMVGGRTPLCGRQVGVLALLGCPIHDVARLVWVEPGWVVCFDTIRQSESS